MEAGCWVLEDSSHKEGDLEASGVEWVGNIDHTATTVNHLNVRRISRCWILDPF